MPAEAIERLEAALGEAAGAEVVLERPGDPTHGDYATNAAMRLAGTRKQPPRAIAEQLVELAAALPDVDRAEIAGPGFVNLWMTSAWYSDALAEILAAGQNYGGGSAKARGKGAGGDGLSESDRPDHRRRRTQRRLRRLRCAVARVRRARGRAGVLLQRRRGADGPLPRIGRSTPAWGGAARERLPGRLCRRARDAARRPGPADAAAHRADAGALSDPLRLVGQAERAREAARRVPAAPGHVREGRCRLGALVGARGRGRPGADPLRDRHADVPRRGCRLPRGQARPRPRPRDLRPRRRPPRHAQLVRGGRADARLRPRSRRGPDLPARPPHPWRRGREDVEAPR